MNRAGLRPVSRSDLLTVLSNIQRILLRATLNEMTYKSSISDVYLETAVPQNTGKELVQGLEQCRCPAGYAGTSCETCDKLYYRDTNELSGSVLGSCKLCPCQRAESCELGSDRRIVCHCEPGYYGERCESSGNF